MLSFSSGALKQRPHSPTSTKCLHQAAAPSRPLKNHVNSPSYHSHSDKNVEEDEGCRTIRRSRHQKFTFPWKLHSMLEAAALEGFEDIVSWREDNTSFKVHNPVLFMEDIHPRFFKRQSKYKSFQRQLNTWQFERVIGTRGPSNGGYYHPCFHRNRTCMFHLMGVKRMATKNNKLSNEEDITGRKFSASSFVSIIDKSPHPKLIEDEEVLFGMEMVRPHPALNARTSSISKRAEDPSWRTNASMMNVLHQDQAHSSASVTVVDDESSSVLSGEVTEESSELKLSQHGVLLFFDGHTHLTRQEQVELNEDSAPVIIPCPPPNQEQVHNHRDQSNTNAWMKSLEAYSSRMAQDSICGHAGGAPSKDDEDDSSFCHDCHHVPRQLGMDDNSMTNIFFQSWQSPSTSSKNCGNGSTIATNKKDIIMNTLLLWDYGKAHQQHAPEQRKDDSKPPLNQTSNGYSTSFLPHAAETGTTSASLLSRSSSSSSQQFDFIEVGGDDKNDDSNHEAASVSLQRRKEEESQQESGVILLLSPGEWKYIQVGMKIGALIASRSPQCRK